MGNWNDILREVSAAEGDYSAIRRKYLAGLHERTGRNVIAYYSGWLQHDPRSNTPVYSYLVGENDISALMATVHRLDRDNGLDLILHTPGGSIATTEAIVQYLRAMFGCDIRAIVPQLAMSAGTMIALSTSQIVMGAHSNLGPFDPQIGKWPAHGIIEEFARAKEEIAAEPANAHAWQPILAKYHPTLVGEAEKAIAWASELLREWLPTGMFAGDEQADAKTTAIIEMLGDHGLTKSHERHFSADRLVEAGIRVHPLEDDGAFQDAVLSVHHAYIQTLAGQQAAKLIENHLGVAFVTPGGENSVRTPEALGLAP